MVKTVNHEQPVSPLFTGGRSQALGVAIFMAVGCAHTAFAQNLAGERFFTYVDGDGVVHVSDNPTDQRFQKYRPGDFERRALRQSGVPHSGLAQSPNRHRPAKNDARARYDAIISNCSKRYSVSFSLIKAVVAVESGFNPVAQSSAGAQGLMQLMPGTAKELGVDNAFDPMQNIDGGTRYLATLLHIFTDEKLALAAYNAGPTRVRKLGAIPPFPETRAYVKSVQKLEQYYRKTGGKLRK